MGCAEEAGVGCIRLGNRLGTKEGGGRGDSLKKNDKGEVGLESGGKCTRARKTEKPMMREVPFFSENGKNQLKSRGMGVGRGREGRGGGKGVSVRGMSRHKIWGITKVRIGKEKKHQKRKRLFYGIVESPRRLKGMGGEVV